MKLDLNPANSFSESESLAHNSFGHGENGFVLAIHEVPSDAYAAHFKVQGSGTVGFSSEVEGIVATKGAFVVDIQNIRGTQGDKLVAYFKSKGLFDHEKVELDDHPPSKTSNKRIGAPPPPKTVKTVDVPLYVKVPANLTPEQVVEHLKSAGATIQNKESGAIQASIPSHKINPFAESFAKTPAFDDKLHKVESLKAYMATKAKNIAGDDHDPDFGKDGEPSPAAAPKEEKKKAGYSKEYLDDLTKKLETMKGPKGPSKTKAVTKLYADLETVSDLPATGAMLHPKGEVGALANKDTGWRGLWVKWAKQQAAVSGHTGKQGLVQAIHAINEKNGELKTFLKTRPTKPAFKAFLKAQVEKHLKK